MATMSLDNLLNVEQSATLIGCTPGRVRQLLRSGELRGVKINARAWLVRKEDAEKMAKYKPATGRPRIGS